MRKNRKQRDNGVVVATVIITVLFVISAGYLVGGDMTITTLFQSKTDTKTFYFLSTDGFDDVTIARQNADLIRNRGGAGYVDLQGNNRIILAVYPDEQSANIVRDKVGDNSLIVSSLKGETIDTKVAGNNLKDDVATALTYFDTAFDTLYNMSNALADDQISIDDVKTQTMVLRNQIEDIKSVFYENTKDSSHASITEIKVAIVTCLALIDGIEIGDLAQTLSSLRRQTVQLVFCYQALCNTLSRL